MVDSTEPIKTVVQIVLINETGDSYHRMRWPAVHLAKQDAHLRIINLDARAEERFAWAEAADLLVLYQSADVELFPVIARRKAQGKKTLVEYNDNFYEPPACAPVAGAWSSPLLWEVYERFMREADGVIVTGPGLKQLFSAVTSKPILELANHFPHELQEFPRKLQDKLIIAWAGSVGHMADLLWCLPTLEKIVEREPNLCLHLMGNSSIPEYVRLSKDKFEFTAWSAMDEYFKFWQNAHIGIAPLLDTPYNNCRSDVKAIEMGSQGVLPLLSNRLPYAEFLKQTGLAGFANLTELESLLTKYIKNRAEIAPAAERAFNYVKSNRLGQADKQRLELYNRYLTKPGNFNFEKDPGYFEVLGTKAQTSKSQQSIEQVNALLGENKLNLACSMLQKLVSDNPGHADLNLAYLKCLIRSNDKSAMQVLNNCKSQFPRDLRFQLLGLQGLLHPVEDAWPSLIKQLKQSDVIERRFFESEVIKTFSASFRQSPALEKFLADLKELFPNNLELNFLIASSSLLNGQDAKALQKFKIIKEALMSHTENKEFLSRIDLAYVETWTQALKSRLEK